MADSTPPVIPTRRVTLEDIARKVGCHKSTVSLALRDSTLLKADTIEQVKRIARELGYHPDPALARLAAHRWGHRPRASGSDSEVIAFVFFSSQSPESVTRYLRSAMPMADAHGFRIETFHLANYPRPERLLQVLRARGITGVIIAPLPPEAASFGEHLDWSEFTVVQCNIGWHRMPTLTTTFNWTEAIRLAWSKTVEKGYLRIGPAILAHDPWAAEDYERFGAVAAMHHKYHDLIAIPPLLSQAHDRGSFLAWFRRHRPDAVICFHSNGYDWLKEAGIPTSPTFGYVSLNGGHDDGTITHTGGSVHNVGGAAVDLLLNAMRNHEHGLPPVARLLSLSPIWYEGATLPGPAKGKKRKTG
jgi:LacI family transcriptional regulator